MPFEIYFYSSATPNIHQQWSVAATETICSMWEGAQSIQDSRKPCIWHELYLLHEICGLFQSGWDSWMCLYAWWRRVERDRHARQGTRVAAGRPLSSSMIEWVVSCEVMGEYLRLELNTECCFFEDSKGLPKNITNNRGEKRYPDSKDLTMVLKTYDSSFLDFLRRCLVWVCPGVFACGFPNF